MDFNGTPEALAALFADLAAAQVKFKPVVKEHKAQAGQYSYAYAKLEDAIEATRPALAEHGLAVIQAPGRADGLVTIDTALVHKGGASVVCSVSASAPKGDIQGIGSAITYLRRYSWLAVLGLAAEDDDGQAAMPAPQAKPLPVKDVVKNPKPDALAKRFSEVWFGKLKSLGMDLTQEQRHLIQSKMLGVSSLSQLEPERMKQLGPEIKAMSDELFAEDVRDILASAEVVDD